MTTDEQAACHRIWQTMLGGDSAPYIEASERIRGFIDDARLRMIAKGESPMSRNPFESASRQPEAEAQADPLAALDHLLETGARLTAGTLPLADDAVARSYADYHDAKEVTA